LWDKLTNKDEQSFNYTLKNSIKIL